MINYKVKPFPLQVGFGWGIYHSNRKLTTIICKCQEPAQPEWAEVGYSAGHKGSFKDLWSLDVVYIKGPWPSNSLNKLNAEAAGF